MNLYLSNAFTKSVKIFPEVPMQHLISLRFLDISFNSFEELAVNTFHAMSDLEVLRAHDCRFHDLHPGTFLVSFHPMEKHFSIFSLILYVYRPKFTSNSRKYRSHTISWKF